MEGAVAVLDFRAWCIGASTALSGSFDDLGGNALDDLGGNVKGFALDAALTVGAGFESKVGVVGFNN